MGVDSFFLLIFAILMVACLVATVAYLLYYIGLFYEITVSVGKPAISNVWIAYKHYSGAYHKCGPCFTEVISLCPKLECIGIFYDDPKIVAADKLRYIVGAVLCQGDDEPSQELVTLLSSRGYRTFQLPLIDHAVRTQFPFIMNVSAVLGAKKAYPALTSYIEHHKLSAHPFIEYYSKDKIHYIAPLSKQSDFFVPEVKYEVSSAEKQESADDFQQDDVSAANNTSDEESQGTSSSFEEIAVEQATQN